jgi:hypothetical protein
MLDSPIIIVDIIKDVVQATDAKLYPVLGKHLDYQPGRSTQIQTELQKMTQAAVATNRAGKYPLIALFQDIPEQRGSSGYYSTVTIPKISIAVLTIQTDPVLIRYDKNFRPILYPIYEEFLRQLCRHKNIVASDPNAIPHIKYDRPGSQPAGQNLNEYLDAIEISNLQLTFKKVKVCSPTN